MQNNAGFGLGMSHIHPVSLPWQVPHSEPRSADRLHISRPPLVTAASCWGPPGSTPTFETFHTDQKRPKVKMDPPQFDGTEVNN